MSVELIIGPMYSGKSTELIRRCKRRMSIGLSVLVINHSLDTRYGNANKISTHDGTKLTAYACNEINDYEMFKQYDVIAIDEAQFFTDLARSVNKLAEDMEKQVIIACLSGDSNRKPWPGIDSLIALSDEIQHCKALCVLCHAPAPFSKKTSRTIKKLT